MARARDALLVWENENVRYLTGLRAQIIAGKNAVLNGCILRAEGAEILLASGEALGPCAPRWTPPPAGGAALLEDL